MPAAVQVFGFIEDFNRFNVSLKCNVLFKFIQYLYLTFSASFKWKEIEIQYQSDVVEPVRKVKIFDVYYNCDGNDEIFWEYNYGNGEFVYQSQTRHVNTDYYNDQW